MVISVARQHMYTHQLARMRAISVPGTQCSCCCALLSNMASPKEISDDLADARDLVAAQVNAGLDRDDVITSMFSSWVTRLSAYTRMPPKGKTMVTNAINAGPWTAEQKKDMASILLEKGSIHKSVAARRPTQKVAHPENFIRMQAMVRIRDKKLARSSRMSMIAAEMRNVGVENPSEQTMYKLIQLLAWGEDNHDFSQEQVLTYMDNVQDFIKSVPRRKELPYLEHYPISAEHLPSEIKDHAFNSGELPVTLDIPELATMLGAARMRGRSHNKKKPDKAPKWLSGIPEEHRATVMAALKSHKDTAATPPTTSHASMHAATHGATSLSSSGSASTHIADTFRFQNPPSLKREIPVKTEARSDHGSDSEPDNVASLNTIDDLESSMVAARSALRAMKKADKKAGTMKRPAAAKKAAAKPVSKKPAAAAAKVHSGPNKKPAAAKKAVCIKTATWKNIHSKIWHAVYKNTGSKESASQACARAKVNFLKGTLRVV